MDVTPARGFYSQRNLAWRSLQSSRTISGVAPSSETGKAPKAPRHRLIGTAGLLLFVCMFLPAVKGCHQPIYPVQTVVFTPPYLAGLVITVIALSKAGHTKGWLFSLKLLAWLTAIGLAAMAIAGLEAGWPALLILPAVGFVMALLSDAQEPDIRAAKLSGMFALASTFWFGWLAGASGDDGLFGLWISLVASVGLTIGCYAWWHAPRPTAPYDPPPIDLPRATVIS